MAPPEAQPNTGALYRRIAPPHFKVRRNWVSGEAFTILPGRKGLSVFRADIASPYRVLEARLHETQRQTESADNAVSERARRFLIQNPNVRALVEIAQYRIAAIPSEAIRAMGFELEEPDGTGHLNILGDFEQFEAHKLHFVELIESGRARILSVEECLESAAQE